MALPIFYAPVVAPPSISPGIAITPPPFSDPSTDYAALTAAKAVAVVPARNAALGITLSGVAKPTLLSVAGGSVSFTPYGQNYALPVGGNLPTDVSALAAGAGTLVIKMAPWDFYLLAQAEDVSATGYVVYENVDATSVSAALTPLVASAKPIEVVKGSGLNPILETRGAINVAFLTQFMAGNATLFVEGGTVIGSAALSSSGSGSVEFTFAFFDLSGCPDSPIPFLKALPDIWGEQWQGHPLIAALPANVPDDPTDNTIFKVGFSTYDGGSFAGKEHTVNVSGSVYYPATSDGLNAPFAGPTAPIVFVVHGMHAASRDPNEPDQTDLLIDQASSGYVNAPGHPGWMIKEGHVEILSHTGYQYLQENLAKMGIICVSVNSNEANGPSSYNASNMVYRSVILGASIAYFQSASSPLSGNINFDMTGLVGHSRGGEAVVLLPNRLDSGKLAADDGLTLTGVTILGVIALAPTNVGSLHAGPTGHAFLTILPAADGDVTGCDGAFYYDQADPSPFKCQLYIDGAMHNYFNSQWSPWELNSVQAEQAGLGLLSREKHERLLSAYACAFFRFLFLGDDTIGFLNGDSRPPGCSACSAHWSFAAQKQTLVVVDDYEEGHQSLKNTLGQDTTPTDVTVGEYLFIWKYINLVGVDLSKIPPEPFTTFYGNTHGMIAQPLTTAKGTYVSPVAVPPAVLDLTDREIWLRVAEVYNDSASFPGQPTGFKLGIEDSKVIAWVSSDQAGGVSRPYLRKGYDLYVNEQIDFTKTMLQTLRFKASYFAAIEPGILLDQIKAIHLMFDRNDGVALAFDDIQLVDPKAVIS